MRKLLEQAELHLIPRKGEFDIEAVAGFILADPSAFRAPRDPKKFLVCYDEHARQLFEQRVREQPEADYPMVLIIEIQPGEVYVNQFAGDAETLEASKKFLTWLLAHYDVTVHNEEGTDLTDDIMNE